MGNILKITHHFEAYTAVRTSPEMRAALAAIAERIADAASSNGCDCEVRASVGATRARVAVMAVDRKAREAEARDKALTQAIGAGRG